VRDEHFEFPSEMPFRSCIVDNPMLRKCCLLCRGFFQIIIYEGQDKNPEMCRVLLTHEIMCRYLHTFLAIFTITSLIFLSLVEWRKITQQDTNSIPVTCWSNKYGVGLPWWLLCMAK